MDVASLQTVSKAEPLIKQLQKYRAINLVRVWWQWQQKFSDYGFGSVSVLYKYVDLEIHICHMSCIFPELLN